MVIDNNLKETRLQYGIDQKELSAATGFSTRTISRVERNMQNPSAEFMLRVSQYLKRHVEDIFEITE